ncbi:MAG: transcription-repair coupling factor, partial [Actinomycetia bacterium]|nr:transcription-repair coupling factor [Actinomycetes bacterium]
SDGTLTPQAVERLQAIAEHDELGSGIKVAMRDLEIRGAGSLVGAEQSGQLSAVGFDLFAAMLSEALADESEGGAETVACPEIRVEIGVPAFLPEEYLPALGARVLWYRRIAAARDREQLDALATRLTTEHGALPEPARNLVTLARIRLGCAALGATSITVGPGPDVTKESIPFVTLKGARVAPELREELSVLGLTYRERAHVLSARLACGKNVADSVATLVDAIVFQARQ